MGGTQGDALPKVVSHLIDGLLVDGPFQQFAVGAPLGAHALNHRAMHGEHPGGVAIRDALLDVHPTPPRPDPLGARAHGEFNHPADDIHRLQIITVSEIGTEGERRGSGGGLRGAYMHAGEFG